MDQRSPTRYASPGGDAVGALSRYTIDGWLGQGGDAEVLAATEPLTGAAVAIKRLLPAGSIDQEPRLFREYQYLRDLDVPGIPRARGLGRDGQAYAIMDRCPGVHAGRWSHRLRDGSAASARPIIATLARAAALVAEVHAAGLVHGDLKPSGFMVDGEHVSLIDFGAARPSDGERLVGHIAESYTSAAYAALELLERREPTAASDVWSLSAIASRLLLGTPPFGDGSRAEVRARITPAALGELTMLFAQWLPAPAVETLRAGFERDPGARPSAAEWRDALGGSPIPPRPALTWASRTWPSTRALPEAVRALREALARGDWSEARRALFAPGLDRRWALVGLAELELELGHVAVAADVVARLDQEDLDADLAAKHLALGLQIATARGRLGSLDAAITAFTRRPALSPAIAVDLAAALAIACVEREDPATATRLLNEATTLADDDDAARLTIETVRCVIGALAGTPSSLPATLVVRAADAGLHAALARLHIAAGDLELARAATGRFAARLGPSESMPLRLAPWLVEAARMW